MSLSRRARRGIANFNSRLKSPRQMRYCSEKLMIEMKPQFDVNIVSAAQAAAEAINASVQIVPESENNPVAPEQEGGAQHGIPVESQTGQEGAEGSEVSEEVCGECGLEYCECYYEDYDDI